MTKSKVHEKIQKCSNHAKNRRRDAANHLFFRIIIGGILAAIKFDNDHPYVFSYRDIAGQAHKY